MKNFLQVIRALAAEKNVFTLNSLSNPDGQPTVNRQSAVALQSGTRSEKAPLSPSCLKCASYMPPTCPRPDSLSLVSRQSDLDQVRAVSVGLSTRVWKHVAMIFAVLVLSMANVGMAWGEDVHYILVSQGYAPLTKKTLDGSYNVLKTDGTTIGKVASVSSSITDAASLYYNSTSSTYANLTNTSKYGDSSTDNRTLKGINIGKGKTATINLGSQTFTKIDVIYRCNSSSAGTLTIAGEDVATSSTSVGLKTKTGSFSSSFTIKATSQDYRVVVILTREYSPSYSVTYDANGGSGVAPSDANTYESDDPVTVLGKNTLSKSGYFFSGWNTKANGTGTAYSPGEKMYTGTNNVTLYAQWVDELDLKYVWKVTGKFCDDQSTSTASVNMISDNDYFTLTGTGVTQESGSSLNLGSTAGNNFLITAKSGYQIKSICFFGKIQDASVNKTTDGSDWSGTITSAGTSSDKHYSFEDINAGCFGVKLSGTSGIWIRNMVITMTVAATSSETWVVAGQWDSYSTSSNTLTGSGTLSTTISLAANKRYEFKIVETVGNTWYGNSGAIIGDMTNWTMATDKNNCRLHTGPAGDYTFTFDPSTKNLSVTYPSVTHPSDYYVYFKNSDVWGTVYGFMTGGSGDFAGWPGTVTNTTTICGETYHYGALLNNDGTYNKIIFNNGGSGYGNQTSDLTMPGAGKYNANRDANWHDFTTYTISFNAGGGTGTMSAIEGLCPNSNQALPANTFEKTDNIFSGWHANVATKVGGSTVAIGGDIADEATLQEINSNIILTAQWTACSGPTISANGRTGIVDGAHEVGDELGTASVTATAGNGGTLSYKWYYYDDSPGKPVDPNDYTAAPGTNNQATYQIPSSSTCTARHYFCVVSEEGCSTTVEGIATGALTLTEPVDPCSEPAEVANEIARFFVPCGLSNATSGDPSAWEVTQDASTEDNTFTTNDFGGSGTNWYRNETSGLIYGKLTGNSGYIQLKLKSGSFQAGDVVTAYFNANNATKTGLTLKTQGSSYAITPANTAAGVETSGSYTLVADAIESDGSIKLFRAGSASYVNRIIVTRAPVAASVTATLLTQEYMPTGATGVQIGVTITGASTGWYYRVKNTGTGGYHTPDNVTYTTTTWTMTSTIGTGANTYVVELYDGTNTNQATSSTITVTGEITHPVTITAGAGGTVSPSGVVQANGNHIKPEIAATPSSGYRFVNWTLSNSNATLADATSATTTITNATGACEITANFEETVGCIDANSTNFGAGNGSGDASKTLADGTVVAMNKCTNSASSVSIEGNILFTAPSGKAFETFSFVATCGSENKTNYYKINGGSQQSLEKSTTTSKTYTITISDEVDATTIQIIKNGTTPAVSSFCYTLKNLCTPPTAPEELGVDSKDETSATLSWDGGSAGANGYKIKLVANDGGSGAFDWKDCAPATYTATGLTAGKNYTFSVKYKGTGAQCEFSEEVTTSFTTTAATTYSITYNCDGASSGCPANVAAATNLPSPLPSGLTKDGYTFDGWYTDSEKTVAAVAGAALTANTTLYAKWTEDECTPTTLFSMVMKSDAADYTLAANEDMTTELTDRIQTLTGGDVMMHNNSSSTKKAIESKCVKLVENDVYLKVKLSGSNTLQEGDVITITTKTAYQPYITKTATRATTPTMTKTGSSDPYTYSITLANTNAASGKDIIGGGTLYFWKASSAVFIRSITITRPCDESAETCKTPNITNIASTTNMTTAETKSLNVTLGNPDALTGTVSYAWTNADGSAIAAAANASGANTARLTLAEPAAGTYTFKCTVTNDCGGGDSQSATSAVFTVVVTESTGCTEIAKVNVSGTSTGTGSGTKIAETGGYGVKLEATTTDHDGHTGYKIGSNNYVYLQLASGEQFLNGDKVKVYITQVGDLGDGKLHIYQGTTGAGTEVATVDAPAVGWNEALLSGVTSGQRSLTVHRGSGTTEQNHRIYAFAVERCVDCTPATHEGLAYTKTSYTVGETAEELTVTNPENVDTYQWKYNTTNDRTGGTTCGTGTASFTPPTTAEVTGTRYYWCELTNDCGTVKTSAVGITVSADLSDVTVTWTDPAGTVNYGGGGYTIKATVGPATWDGTLDASMLTAPEGIRIYDVTTGTDGESKQYIQAKFDVQTTFDREANATAIPFALTLAATANYDGITSNHNVTYEACTAGGGGGNVYVIGYSNNNATNVSSSSAFRAYETASDWYTEGNTTFTDKTTTDGFTIKGSQKSGYYWRNDGTFSTSGGDKSRLMTFKLTKSDKITITWTGETVSFSKVRIIGRNTSDDATTYTVSNGTTEKTFTYEAGLGGKVQIKEVEMECVSGSTKGITISGGTKECNVLIELTPASSGGTETTVLTWSNSQADGVTLAKDEGTADFAVTAVRDAAATTSLGALTYSSSDQSVATVNETTGQVHIADNIDFGGATYKETTITATLAASGCYKRAQITYILRVNARPCDDVAGTVTSTSDGCTTTLTLSGYTAGATIQWYKDGVEIEGATSPTYDATAAGEYYAVTHSTCDRTSNTVTVTSTAVSATKIVDEWYVKNGRRTPDIALVKTENASSFTVKVAGSTITNIGGCGFYLGTDGIIYLAGSHNGSAPSGMTEGDDVLSITATGCSDAAPVSVTIHRQVETDKYVLAYVVTGKQDGGWTENPPSNQTTGVELYRTLTNHFDLQATNIYATTDEQKIKEYYSRYDIIFITDYPNTKLTNKTTKKSYVNALGAMIDIRPILTMEAWVSGLSNWSAKGVAGSPKSPTTRQYNMLLQCKDHEIFSGTTVETIGEGDEMMFKINMVDSTKTLYDTLDTKYGAGTHKEKEGYCYGTHPALQGFVYDEALADMLPLGLIDDGAGNDLQVGLERQKEMEARMMVLGINADAMERLSDDGETVIVNALKYLMKKDAEDISDCSIYFDNADGDNQWNNVANWGPSHLTLPLPSQEARIMAPCIVNGSVAKAASVKIVTDGTYNHGTATANGSLTIRPTGILSVGGRIVSASAPNYYETRPTDAGKLVIQADNTHTGTLIHGQKSGTLNATVQLVSKAYSERVTEGGKTKTKKYWQYVGLPVQEALAEEAFYGGYTYKYEESAGWEKKRTGDMLEEFWGIGLSYDNYVLGKTSPITFTISGALALATNRDIELTKTDGAGNGENMIGNSWTAPIHLVNMTAEDFENATATIYLFNTGRNDSHTNSAYGSTTAGQWVSVPVAASKQEPWVGPKVIPAMQAFEVDVAGGATSGTLHLNYDKHVRAIATQTEENEPLRAPKRYMDDEPMMLRLRVADSATYTDLYLIEGEQLSDEFDNGWDGKYQQCDGRSATLYALSPIGNMAVLAQQSVDNTVVVFRPGKYTDYTFTFGNSGEESYYLNDVQLETSTEIKEGNEYRFTYNEGDMEGRFVVSKTPYGSPGTATGIGHTGCSDKVQKIMYNDHIYIIRAGRIYDIVGKQVR